MTSTRLKHVYNTSRWQALRRQMIALAGGRCQHLEWVQGRGWVRCTVRDKAHGGTQSLTVDHTNEYADPYDPRFLKVLCRPHHGKKDGGKRLKPRSIRV